MPANVILAPQKKEKKHIKPKIIIINQPSFRVE